MSQPNQQGGRQVLKAAGAMGVATFLSRIMGLVREQVFAYLFGAGNVTDAFQVAFRIPNLMRDLFAEGAMSAALVPIFTRTRVEEGDARAWRVAGLVFRVLFSVVAALALLGIIFAPQLVALYASAFKQISGKFELTVALTRIMFPFFPLVALAAAFMGVLNACGVFFVPAFSSALFNVASVIVGVITAKVLFASSTTWHVQPITGMAIGVVVGGLVQAFYQLPSLYRVGYRWASKNSADPLWYQDPRLKQMLWMMIPGTIGLAATQINILVNTILATDQGPGAVSWLSYAFRLMQFPIGIFGVSLASATLARVSYQWARGEVSAVSDTLTRSIRSVFAVNFPAAAGLAFLGPAIIELIFQYGRFTREDTLATAMALTMYAVGLPAYSVVKVLVPACYALGNTRLPVISSALSVVVTLTLNILMVKSFGYWGLALGTSIAAMVNAVFLIVAIYQILRARQSKLSLGLIWTGFLAYLMTALVMGVACYFSQSLLQSLLPGQRVLERALRMAILVSEGGLLMVLMARAFRLREFDEVIDIFLEKLKNKLRRIKT